MKEPVRRVSVGGQVRWTPPDKEWLENQYITLRKSAVGLSQEIGSESAGTLIFRWLRLLGIPRRTRAQAYILMGQRARGDNSPNWKEEGHSRPRSHAVKVLRFEGIPEVCVWCGCTDKLEAHHRDHNKHNNEPENLQWMCYHCNRLEAHLWYVHNLGKAVVEAEGDTITIWFPYRESKY